MVQVSTEKAVNPTNIMGASKRRAEALNIEARGRRPTGRMPAPAGSLTVCFDNVLGSSGSVVPLFQRQLE